MGRLQILLSMNTCSDKKSRKQVWSKSVTNNGLLSSFVAAINYKIFSLRYCSKTLNSCFCVPQANSLTKFVFQSPWQHLDQSKEVLNGQSVAKVDTG